MFCRSKAWACLIAVSLPLIGYADDWDTSDDVVEGATVLSVNEYEQTQEGHTLDASDINDFFKISMVSGNLYYFETIGTSDTYGELYSDIGLSNLVDDDSTSGVNNNFRIEYTSPSSGDYYLQVRSATIGASASYALRYLELTPSDDWDPNDDSGINATELSIGQTLQQSGPHVLGVSDLDDWFKFILISGVEYQFRSKGSWDPYAALYSDSSGITMVAESDDIDFAANNLNFLITYTPTDTGEYYLQVASPWHPVASYILQYQESSAGDTDGDGMSDADESIAGTDPNDKFSYFAITNWSAGSFTIEWPAFSGRVYRVFRADSLTNTFNQIGPVILYPTNSYTESSLGESGFYKVEVQLQ